jgi:hypothetical protein
MVTFTLHKPSGDPIYPPFFGIADSGADSTMFPMDVMDDLGLTKADCDECDQLGAGGMSKYLDWKGKKLPADFYGARTVNLSVPRPRGPQRVRTPATFRPRSFE